MNPELPLRWFKGFLCYLPVLIVLSALILIGSCSARKSHSYASPPGYNFTKPYIYKLPTILDEISGLFFYPKDSGIFAIQDEKGWLFKIHLKKPLQIERWKFSNGADYEDISLVDSTFYVLKSKGAVEKFRFATPDSVSLQSSPVGEGKNEFETLYYDSSQHQLMVICKNCAQDTRKEVSSFAFDPSSNTFSSSFKIETNTIREELGEDDKFRFKPSAAAIHPLTGELYIIASVNRALVILKKDHSVRNAYRIDPSLFKQPEGLTFTPKGDLIISNEAADRGVGELLFFKYNKPK
jgi:SdiA-regulated protein